MRKQRVLSLWKSGHSSSILGCGQDLHVERWGKKAFQERDPIKSTAECWGWGSMWGLDWPRLGDKLRRG